MASIVTETSLRRHAIAIPPPYFCHVVSAPLRFSPPPRNFGVSLCVAAALLALVAAALTLRGVMPRGALSASATIPAVPDPVVTLPFELPRIALMDRVLGKDHWDLSLSRDPVAAAVHSQAWARLPAEMPPALWAEVDQVTEAFSPADAMEARTLPLALDDPNLHIQIARQQRAKLAWHEALFGPVHPDTLASRRQLAVILQAQGQPAEAEAELRAMLAIRMHLLGAAHAATLALRNDLATLLLRQRRPAEAESQYRTVLTLRTRTLGAAHPRTLSSASSLANAIDAQGRHGEAEAGHRAVLVARERGLGSGHPSVRQSCWNLALALANQGKIAEAVGYSARAQEGRNPPRAAAAVTATSAREPARKAGPAVAAMR